MRYLTWIVFLTAAPPLMAQWTQTPAPSGGTITAFAVCKGLLFAGATADGVYRSSDDGATWTIVTSGLANTGVWTLAVMNTVLYAGTYGGGVFRSNDAGTTWSAASDGLSSLYVLSLASDGSTLYAGTIGGLFRSDDGGMGWTLKDAGMTTISVRSLAVVGSLLFAGTYGGGIFSSTDQGNSWTSSSDGLTNLSILNFARIGSSLFVGTYGGMFHSTDAGQNWSPMSLASSNTAGASIVESPPQTLTPHDTSPGVPFNIAAPKAVYSMAVSGRDLFVGTYGGGVHKSTDNGASWIDVNAGLGDLYLNLIAVQNSYIYAGTLAGQIWRRQLSEVTGVGEGRTDIPRAIRLAQNFPNPFNPETSIRYEIPRPSDVKLEVCDVFGREVAVLAHGRRDAGSYTVRFNASTFASGVYIYRLEAEGFSQSRRMILLR